MPVFDKCVGNGFSGTNLSQIFYFVFRPLFLCHPEMIHLNSVAPPFNSKDQLKDSLPTMSWWIQHAKRVFQVPDVSWEPKQVHAVV